MAKIRIYDAARTGIDMSHWNSGFTAFSTAGTPTYLPLAESWIDANTVEAIAYTEGSSTLAYAYMLADDVGSGMILRSAYYADENLRTSFTVDNVNIYISYPDLLSGSTDWFGFGLQGNDKIIGNRYGDIIKGAGGNDTLIGKSGSDKLYGERGNDTLVGGGGNDKLFGAAGNDVAKGGGGNDRIISGGGHDKLIGGGGDDKLVGGGGRDSLDGGRGNDVLKGGAGPDVFEFNRSSGKDKVLGFSGSDELRIESGANRVSDLEFTDSKAGLLIEFGSVDIFLRGLDRSDLTGSDFDFV